MKIRPATEGDLPRLLEIYDDARRFMRENGNLEQWSGGYPNEAVLREDLSLNRLFICEEDGEPLGVFCFFIGEDPTYLRIYEGQWLNDRPYGVIHRIAVAQHRRGVAAFCYDYCFSVCPNLKIDTHRDNLPMQRSLSKNGFLPCGIIYLASGDERIAYQKEDLLR